MFKRRWIENDIFYDCRTSISFSMNKYFECIQYLDNPLHTTNQKKNILPNFIYLNANREYKTVINVMHEFNPT